MSDGKGILTEVTFETDRISAANQLSPNESATLEKTVAGDIHAGGMYGHGVSSHLGSELHKEQVARQIIAGRRFTPASA